VIETYATEERLYSNRDNLTHNYLKLLVDKNAFRLMRMNSQALSTWQCRDKENLYNSRGASEKDNKYKRTIL
jgi:hypothetical protein